MVSRYGRKIIFLSVLIFAVLGFFYFQPYFLSKKQEISAIQLISCYENIQNGDVVCRLGNGFYSRYFKALASDESEFSHIGILINEDNEWFVFHTEADEFTGEGGVKKEKLDAFLNGVKKVAIFPITVSDSIREKIVEICYFHYYNATAFDFNFDIKTDDELYCTEFVAKTYNQSLNKKIIKPSLRLNNQLFFGLDDIYKNDFLLNGKTED